MSDLPPVRNHEAAHRFELEIDGTVAELVYELHGDRLVLVHTGVPDELEGKGVGGRLVTAAVAAAEEHGWTVVPRCPFARRWLQRHPDAAARIRVEVVPD
ncbi:MAG: acetyltransferase [Acidimicrobiales bacterium]|nr:acetyltransferase [Acidimicrobiales bacterium]